MRKTAMKLVALGMVIGVIGTTGAVLAASSLTSIQVSLDPIRMNVNGERLQGHGMDGKSGQYFNGKKHVPTTMIYEGTTYVPVRLAAESFGYQVDWDGKNRVINFQNDKQPPKGIVAGSLETTISHDVNKDGSIDFKFVLKNQTEREMTLSFSSGQRFDYNIRNAQGDVVKNYAADKLFIQALGEKVLKQGEEWIITDQADSLPKGEYTIEFWITSKEEQAKQNYTFTIK
ncbi:BsuPI-related putative proteinase inhibitor [Ammoniphilus sp. CFH 90114]|uniref:BsuPI-related putative proteinase inhibitor n=1 Tax=Ammoniphilus sp. CFH 90114 TaxID=2493665 RepID=UPI00100F69A1|nr:BsuPI-related putative proteinase inhibitor [Ammoniphilus sp. CFH 90114]RXT07035.1 hypothetical protein EIZ39_12825 [Ammoniphilus sp. CFH 90114]